MILFFGTRDHVDTVNQFITSWAPELRAYLRTASYENISFDEPVHGGVCIFMDFERLRPIEMSLARRLAAALRAFPEKYSMLNEPARYIGRMRLLEVLHQRGINEFRAFRVEAMPGDLKFPVFLRNELNHDGPATTLLQSPIELKDALSRDVFQSRQLRKHLMVTEFCNCREPDGLFRKYAVMNIGGTLIPRHLFFSPNWVVKLQSTELFNAGLLAEEEKFMEDFPHAAQTLEIFRLAGVDYGRMDYSLRNGRIQVWEINTNPTVVPQHEKIHPLRLRLQTESARHVAAAFQALATGRPSSPGFPFRSVKLLPAKVLQYFSRRGNLHHRK